MPARLLAALIALAACGPLQAAEPTSLAPEPPAAAEPGPVQEPAPDGMPAGPQPPAAEVPATADAPTEAAPAVEPPAPAAAREREVEGTKLLFLRMTLRIKLVEQELLSMSPDRLLEHMGAAADLLDQLRSRPLEEPEIARAESMEQYLQFLAESYVQLHAGNSPKKPKKRRK